MSYCSHCGSSNAPVAPNPNPGMEMWVASSDDGCTEFFDDVEYLVCGDCGETTYKSPSTMPKMTIRPKTTRIMNPDPNGIVPNAQRVLWCIDGEWVYKGWLLPQVGQNV